MCDNIWLLLAILFLILYLVKENENVECFYAWNIPTRWNTLPYDIRRHPYYFIHNGNIYSDKYLNLRAYPELSYYLPYYNNGMIYTAEGKYKYDQFSRHYPNFPILYPYSSIDWMGLVNNGLVTIK